MISFALSSHTVYCEQTVFQLIGRMGTFLDLCKFIQLRREALDEPNADKAAIQEDLVNAEHLLQQLDHESLLPSTDKERFFSLLKKAGQPRGANKSSQISKPALWKNRN